jgi:FMN phosphatase YigB (HAD superfamily)
MPGGQVPVVDIVLLDIGGVLTSDPWQSIVLTPGRGLADLLGIERAAAEATGKTLWPKYSLSVHDEGEYWNEFARSVGCAIPAGLVRSVELKNLEVNSSAKYALVELDERSIPWGFITDNTAFWYRKQLGFLGLSDRRDASLDFPSFECGVAKSSNGRNLFEVAAAAIDPARTLIVDDRLHNIDRASQAGFVTLRYSMHDGLGLRDALGEFLG